MAQRMVIALGGNAILSDSPTAESQIQALRSTSQHLVKLIEAGHQIIITHGNGPQVGNLLLQQNKADSPSNPAMPLDTCISMTQGSIGYWLQNQMNNVLRESGIEKHAVAIVTQIEVNENDEAFEHPTKPIGPFLTKEEAKSHTYKTGDTFIEDAGRGYRKVVASPKPIKIIEADVVETLLNNQIIPIAAGGGGVCVVKTENGYQGVEAVIDKDYASCELAKEVHADELIILTAVSQVKINYQTPEEKNLSIVSVGEMKKYIEEGHFAPGSMLPKVKAAVQFVEGHPERKAIITSLDNLENMSEENMTIIIQD